MYICMIQTVKNNKVPKIKSRIRLFGLTLNIKPNLVNCNHPGNLNKISKVECGAVRKVKITAIIDNPIVKNNFSLEKAKKCFKGININSLNDINKSIIFHFINLFKTITTKD